MSNNLSRLNTMLIKEEQILQPPIEPTASEKLWALLGIAIGEFMFGLDNHIVNIALPTLVESFHTSFATIQWVILSYMLTLTVLTLGAGRLGDMFRKKPLYLAGMLLFTVSSLLCGLAPSVGFLIGFRVLQGLGAVFMTALGVAIITEIFPQQERGRALGILVRISSVAYALGPAVGGLLIGIWNWRFVFLVNVPIGLVASWIVARVVPKQASSGALKPFDWIGALLMTLTLSSFALGLTQGQQQGFSSMTVLIWLTLAAISLACFLLVEARLEEPMLDLKIFQSLQLNLCLLLNWITCVIFAGLILIKPFFLELVKQYPPQQVGLLLSVPPVISALIAPVAGSLSDRFGVRIISLIGLVLMALGCFAISTFDADLTSVGFIVRVAPWALGLATFMSSNNSAIMGAAPKERLGIASGLLYLSQNLGFTIGVPLLGALFSTVAMTHAGVESNINFTDITIAPVEVLVFGVQTTFRLASMILIALVILKAFLWGLEKKNAQTSRSSVQ